MGKRLHLVGSLEGQALVDAYHAMDVFVFASCTETQGMVLTEAMAAGKPVVALDGPGVREVVRDGSNGRLLTRDARQEFAAAIGEIGSASSSQRRQLEQGARETAERFSMDRCGRELLNIYDRLREPPTARTQGRERLAPRHGRDQSGVGTAQEHGRSGRPGHEER